MATVISAIPAEVFGGIAWYALLLLAFAKIVSTLVTLGFGGSGGVFTPTLFIGAALGGGIGRVMASLAPTVALHPERWAMVGMAGLVAGAARAPLTAMFMVFELTDDYTIVPPLMLVTVLALYVSRKIVPYGLYDGWLERRGEHLGTRRRPRAARAHARRRCHGARRADRRRLRDPRDDHVDRGNGAPQRDSSPRGRPSRWSHCVRGHS